jgi:predicted ATP-dependent endonuclease of OLD family
MKLVNLKVDNYRSIQKQTFELKEIDGGLTFTLIGVNESGKSSLLKAISLIKSTEIMNNPRPYGRGF